MTTPSSPHSHPQHHEQHHPSAQHPQHHNTPHKPHHKMPPHKHALRIGALLGVLFIVIGAFASARTSFFGLLEKEVNDNTLTGFVPEGLPCKVDATGACLPEEAEPCVIDATGNCLPKEPEENPQEPVIPVRQPDCIVQEGEDCGNPPEGEPEELPQEPENVPEEEPWIPQEAAQRFPWPQPEPEPEVVPEPQPEEEIIPEPEMVPAPEPEEVIAPEPEPQAPVTPEPQEIFVPLVPEPLAPVVIAPEEKAPAPKPVLVLPPAPTPKPAPLPKLDLDVPEDSCLYFDANHPVVMSDVNPENKSIAQLPTLEAKAIVVLSRSYVKNSDGTRSYIIEGSPIKGRDSNLREFVPQANIIRRDAAKLEILIHCLEIKSVDYLKRVGQTVSGKAMPNFEDLPLTKIQSFNDSIIYSAAFYDIINGTIYGSKIQADGQRDTLIGEAVKTFVRTRQMIMDKVLTQDSPTGAWYNAFFDSALDEGLGVEDMRVSGNEPITRGRFAQELLELALLRHMYSNQQEVETLLYTPR